MMKSGQDIFCTEGFFDEIIRKRKSEPFKTLYQILFRLGDIYLDIKRDALQEKINQNQIYKNLNNREDKGLHAKLEWKNRVNFDKNSDQLYLIESGYINDCKEISTKKGALILPNEESGYEYLNKINKLHEFALIPTSERDGIKMTFAESWQDVFNRRQISPINSLIITDNYQFNKNFDRRKKYSLFNLLSALIPKELDTDFHLTIFFYNDDGQFNQQKALELIKEIKELHLMNDDSKLKISIVSHTKKSTTHDRHILSNYYYIYSGAGFSVIDERGIQEVARGDSKCVYHSISNMVGDYTVKDDYNITRNWLKKIYDQKEGTGGASYKVGDDFVNRLLDDTSVLYC